MTIRQHATLPFVALSLALPLLAQANSLHHPALGEVGFTEHPTHWQGSKTRAQVAAETMAARQDGTLNLLLRGLPLPQQAAGPAKTRQQVVAELLNEPADQRRARLAQLAGG